MTRLAPTLALALCTTAAALAAGCGSSGDDGGSAGGGDAYGGGAAPAQTATDEAAPAAASSGASGGSLELAADETDGLAFTPKALTAKAGRVTITMDNPKADSLPHAVAVEGPGGLDEDGAIAQPGGTSKVSLDLKPGTYTFYCPVGSHRSAGMEGTLTVR